MSKIIGHRGAAGVALENTLESIKLAQHMGVDGIEFDVRVTKDGKVVVCHDSNVSRISSVDAKIKDVTYAELQAIALHNDEIVPLLSDVLIAAKITPVVVEIKVKHRTEEILRIIDQFPDANITMASFHREVVRECKQLRPKLPAFLAEEHNPIEVIRAAKEMNADGIDLSYVLLNPINYMMAKKAGLQLMVFTVDQPLIVRAIRKLYPDVWICTNRPERFIVRPKQKKGANVDLDEDEDE